MEPIQGKTGWERVKSEHKGTDGKYVAQHDTLLHISILLYKRKNYNEHIFQCKKKVPVATKSWRVSGLKGKGFCSLKSKHTRIFDKRILYTVCPNILKTF